MTTSDCPVGLQLPFRQWKGHDKRCSRIVKPVTNPTAQASCEILRDSQAVYRPPTDHLRPIVGDRAMSEAVFPRQLDADLSISAANAGATHRIHQKLVEDQHQSPATLGSKRQGVG